MWEEFISHICQRFATRGYENLVGQFNKLTQKGKVEEYVKIFEELKAYMSAQNKHYSENYFIESFLSGLKEEIATSLYVVKPLTLRDAINQARGQEVHLESLDKRQHTSPRNLNSSARPPFPVSKEQQMVSKGSGPPKVYPIKRLSATEMAARRDKGLCFHCDEVYTLGHRCKNKHIYIMILEEEESCQSIEEPEPEMAMIIQEAGEEKLQIREDCGVSIHAITGTNGLHTIKLKGQSKNHYLSMLLDSGSTHNFLSESLVKKCQLITEPCSPIKVTVANGDTIRCEKMISKFSWEIEQGKFITPMYVIPLGAMMLF